jgi:hypothetical protein
MKGSWSIKAVAPTLDSGLSYDRLSEIQDGGAAMNAYLELLDPVTDKRRRNDVRSKLAQYCRLDTLAMQRMVCHIAKQ